MKNNKIYLPLVILGVIQIGTAIFFMLPNFIIQAVGFITVPEELDVYLYVVCSLYFSVGVLYIIGAFITEVKFSALIIVCVDIPLEAVSYFAGFPRMHLPYWLISMFSIIIIIPFIFCLLHLQRNYRITGGNYGGFKG